MRYRQALASPHSANVHDMCPAPLLEGARGEGRGVIDIALTLYPSPLEDLMKVIARGVAALSLALALSACAGTLRNPDIADVKQNAGHYSDRTVTVDGTVTSSWGIPLVPFKMYKVDDGTGEITVLARGGNRTPSKGSRVKVKGVVRDVAMFNGMPLGLHLEERDLNIRRN
jgi:hypothetical protein